MYTGSWDLRAGTLTLKPPKDAYHTPDEKAVWAIRWVNTACIVFSDDSSMSYVLQRLR
jgi:hypothetical protein